MKIETPGTKDVTPVVDSTTAGATQGRFEEQ